ncbi:hypothetical protein RchiOBHm_Chr4g0427751 [Rosa chinensis]|uniref:Uncharacterized protein n=1 Tax=Rosa chinensis TaxID=74649 RepID=A0A2P6QZT7_ROSCH|nr:hypothetical protein RchiOBHm_Chr4g0427751 [Rosa chinensis]
MHILEHFSHVLLNCLINSKILCCAYIYFMVMYIISSPRIMVGKANTTLSSCLSICV